MPDAADLQDSQILQYLESSVELEPEPLDVAPARHEETLTEPAHVVLASAAEASTTAHQEPAQAVVAEAPAPPGDPSRDQDKAHLRAAKLERLAALQRHGCIYVRSMLSAESYS